MTLKEFTDLMCTNVKMRIELRDTDNQEIFVRHKGVMVEYAAIKYF